MFIGGPNHIVDNLNQIPHHEETFTQIPPWHPPWEEEERIPQQPPPPISIPQPSPPPPPPSSPPPPPPPPMTNEEEQMEGILRQIEMEIRLLYRRINWLEDRFEVLSNYRNQSITMPRRGGA